MLKNYSSLLSKSRASGPRETEDGARIATIGNVFANILILVFMQKYLNSLIQNNLEKKRWYKLLTWKMKEQDITTDFMDIKRITKEYYKQLYGHKFYNLDEINKFLKSTLYQNSHKDNQIICISLYLLKIWINN